MLTFVKVYGRNCGDSGLNGQFAEKLTPSLSSRRLANSLTANC